LPSDPELETKRVRGGRSIADLTIEEGEDQMFHHILFPIDFSERCKQTVPYVKVFAKHYGAKVILMHVIQIPTGWYGGVDGGYPIMFDIEEMERDARRELINFYTGPNGADPKLDVTETVTEGEPGSAIVQYAEQAGVDLIMMPTHGYGKFRRFLVGSVTARVLHDAHCAVWTAAHTEEDAAGAPECRQILCAVDGSEKSLPVISDAVLLGCELTAKVRLVHAVPFLDSDLSMSIPDGARLFNDSARRSLQELQRRAGTNLERCLESGNVSDVVRKAAMHHDADLVVIGRGKFHERFGGLRTNVYAIIRDSPCPVLSV
jgi:nucleotide-binding universal stress UspA family protein